MRILLDEDDAPNPADREAAKRLIEEMVDNDVHTRATFVLEGYVAARRIAQALTAAHRDERRRGFETPFRMRKTRPATGSPAVLAKRTDLRPLYHWLEVDGVRLQSYRAGIHNVPMISDDGRITVIEHENFWTAHIDGVEVVECGLTRRFPTMEVAVCAALAKLDPVRR